LLSCSVLLASIARIVTPLILQTVLPWFHAEEKTRSLRSSSAPPSPPGNFKFVVATASQLRNREGRRAGADRLLNYIYDGGHARAAGPNFGRIRRDQRWKVRSSDALYASRVKTESARAGRNDCNVSRISKAPLLSLMVFLLTKALQS
jgi:hypothetical protein